MTVRGPAGSIQCGSWAAPRPEAAIDRTRVKLLLGGLVVLSAFAYLFVSGMRASSVYYLTVSEYQQKAHSIPPGEHFRISGRVQPGTVDVTPSGLDLSFAVYEPGRGSAVMPVTYHGVVPDTFMENSEVVVEGAMRGETFVAHTLLAKCPSKYEAMADEQARREAGEARGDAAAPAGGPVPPGS